MSFLEKTKQFLGLEDELLESLPLKLQQTEDQKRRQKLKKTGREFSFPNPKSSSKNNISQNDIMIVEPRVFEDSLSVSTWLKKGNPVIVNIKHLDAASGKRFIDFICGSAYAFEGHMHRLGGTIFLFTPAQMGIIPSNSEELAQGSPDMQGALYEDETIQYTEPQEETGEYEYFDPAQDESSRVVEYA